MQFRVWGAQKHWTFVQLSQVVAACLKLKPNVPYLMAWSYSLPLCCLIPLLPSTLILAALRRTILMDRTKISPSPRVTEVPYTPDPIHWETLGRENLQFLCSAGYRQPTHHPTLTRKGEGRAGPTRRQVRHLLEMQI